jgi:hypothetical protein
MSTIVGILNLTYTFAIIFLISQMVKLVRKKSTAKSISIWRDVIV